MSIQEVSAEQLAELFFHYHQALGPDFGCKKQVNPESWNELPKEERNRAVAAARLALLELDSAAKEREDSRRYFAKPGEAESGLLSLVL
jgi:hypothetical protein